MTPPDRLTDGPPRKPLRAYADVVTDFSYTDLLPRESGGSETPYRLVTTEGINVVDAGGRSFVSIEPEVLRLLTYEAFHDISHLLRPDHLTQLASILDDPEASPNDRFVALDLLKNANISAGGVLPMCQDTGTAIVMGKRGQSIWTTGQDEEHISRGVFDAYRDLNLRYSQLSPLSMWKERNTGSNLPAQIEIYADTSTGHENTYEFLFIAKGGGSANKSFLFQETTALLKPETFAAFLDEKLRQIGTAACPPYHLAIVVGGTSAEHTLKTAKLASAHYLDDLPIHGTEAGHGYRDLAMEADVLHMTQQFGIGAQFGGKYFCHDVRVIRLPRHGASCPVGIAVSCSADRQALAKITAEGAFLEQLEPDPAQIPPRHHRRSPRRGRRRPVGSDRTYGSHPRDIVDTAGEDPSVTHRPTRRRPRPCARSNQGDVGSRGATTRLPQGPRGLLRRPGEDARGLCLGLLRPDNGRPHGLIRRPIPKGWRFIRHVGERKPQPRR